MNCLLILVTALSVVFQLSFAHVRQFQQNDFDKWVDDKNFLVVLFCQSLTDKSCHRELSGLKKLADSFIYHKDIIFGYIDKETDHILFSRYNIQRFPFLKFFPYATGSVDHRTIIKFDETRKAILDIREKYMKETKTKKEAERTKKRVLTSSLKQIDWLDIDTTVQEKSHHSLLVLYDDGCGEPCMIIQRVAEAFISEDNIQFYKLHINNIGKYKESLPFTNNPSVFWFPKSNKQSGYVYGGSIRIEVLLEFINDNAGLGRDIDGNLKNTAGRIPEIDQIINENIINILLKRNLEYVIYLIQQKSKELPHAEEFINYYLAIIKELKRKKDLSDKILEREHDFVSKRISQKKLNSSDREYWHKYFNIINGIIEMANIALNDNKLEMLALQEDPYVISNSQHSTFKINKHSRHDEL